MPPKLPPKFPSKQEREKLIEELTKEGKGLTANDHYRNYVASLQTLNEMMDHYYTPDADGNVQPLEEKGKNDLTQAILDTANFGEMFLADVQRQGGKLTTGTPDLVGRVQGMMSQDYEMLSLYDPENMEMTLPEIQQDARTQVVDLRGVSLGKMGNAQSSRIPMTVVDEKGRKRSGVFTKASHVSILKPFEDMAEKVATECGVPGIKQQIEELIPNYRKYLQDRYNKGRKPLIGNVNPKDANDEMILGEIYQQMIAVERTASFTDILHRAGMDGKLPSNVSFALNREMTKLAREPANWINGVDLGLKEGARLDQRNSAMSAVANLLGVPKLVAHSTNMKCIDEEGNVVEGTFMAKGVGLDLRGKGNERLFSQVDNDPFEQESNLNKDLADMQVLDFICGNVDRHSGNLFYTVDEKTGKITGAQGIDNDSSFGLYSSGKDGRNFRLAGTDSLTVVSEDMAKKISSISPEMLKFTLRGRGLTDQEIQAACGRLQDVKDAVKEPMTRDRTTNAVELTTNKMSNKLSIMSAETLRKMPINSLTNGRRNLFDLVTDGIENAMEEARKAGYTYVPQKEGQKIEQKGFKEVTTTSRRFTAAGIGESLRGMSRMIRNEVTGFVVTGLSKLFRSSDKWRAMVSSVKAADQLSAQLKKDVGEDGALDREDPKVKAQLEKANEAMEAVRKATQEYLDKKMKEKKVTSLDQLVGKNEYEQKRIDYARKVMKGVEEYDRIAKPQKAEDQAEKDAVKSGAELAAKRREKAQDKGVEVGA